MSDCRTYPNKMQFLTEADAKQYIRDGQTKKGPSIRLQAYQCPNCLRWHLTHHTKKAQRRIERLRG